MVNKTMLNPTLRDVRMRIANIDSALNAIGIVTLIIFFLTVYCVFEDGWSVITVASSALICVCALVSYKLDLDKSRLRETEKVICESAHLESKTNVIGGVRP